MPARTRARDPEPLVSYADGDEASSLAQMLGGLIEANIGSRPEKWNDFQRLRARVGIEVDDIEEAVTLDFLGGRLTVHNGLKPNRQLTISSDSDTVMQLSSLRIGPLGLPVYVDSTGRSVFGKLLSRRLRISGLPMQLEKLNRVTRIFSVAEPVTTLAVVGAGTMGAQIAQQAALQGVEAWLQDVNPEQLEKAVTSNRGHLARRLEKGRLGAEEMEAALDRVHPTTDLARAVVAADVVIEAILERLEPKKELFRQLGELAPASALLASNSSTIGISALAPESGRPELCCNLHFFNPVLVMDLVEVVKGPATSEATVDRAVSFAHEIGRTPVVLRREIDGFIVNRILHAASQEAYRLLDAGVASFEDIDTAVEKGLNWPLGPFRLGDFSGLDVTYNARLHMWQTTGDERYRPSPQLEAKVRAGELGRKTGRGWYTYE